MLLTLLPLPAVAQDDLYSGEIAVVDQGAPERERAVPLALQQVLGKLSGLRDFEAYPGVRIYAHKRMIERVAAGAGENWIEILNSMTENAIHGTKAISPNHGLTGGESLTIGDIKFNIHHTGKAHTDHDIMIEISNDKAIFLGDIVTDMRVPSSDVPHDAYYKGQITAIKKILLIFTSFSDRLASFFSGFLTANFQQGPPKKARAFTIRGNEGCRVFHAGRGNVQRVPLKNRKEKE